MHYTFPRRATLRGHCMFFLILWLLFSYLFGFKLLIMVAIISQAFRIVNKEWEYSHKKGFKCTFERGILHVYFNFKRYRYRRWNLGTFCSTFDADTCEILLDEVRQVCRQVLFLCNKILWITLDFWFMFYLRLIMYVTYVACYIRFSVGSFFVSFSTLTSIFLESLVAFLGLRLRIQVFCTLSLSLSL